MTDILALDPGVTTGWASFSDGPTPTYDAGEIVIERVWGLLNELGPHRVVIEMFDGPVRSKFFDPTPYKVIGIVEEWCRHLAVEAEFQKASAVKHFFTDDRLRARDMYRKGRPHANDAMRHLLYARKAFTDGV